MRVRILSVRRPWSHYLITGAKDIENRDWTTSYRGVVLIHASRRPDAQAVIPVTGLDLPAIDDMPQGGIVGAAILIDCVTEHSSPWFSGKYGFVMQDAIELPFTPCLGSLGLNWASDQLIEVFKDLPAWRKLLERQHRLLNKSLPLCYPMPLDPPAEK